DFAFGIRAPLDLSGKFGSSFYAAARRYVTTRRREACVLAVFERPVRIIGKGECMKPRRVIPSPMFCTRFRNLKWPEEFGPESFFVQNRPKNKFTAARPCVIKDADGHSVSCLAEAFDSSHAIFFLIYDPATVGTSVRL